MAKYDLKKKVRLGILGGTFDPAHKGHLKISKVAQRLFKLDKIVWAITEKNPFKSKSFYSLKKRVKIAKNAVFSLFSPPVRGEGAKNLFFLILRFDHESIALLILVVIWEVF